MRVKGIITLLTSIFMGVTLSPISAAADLPSFEIKSVSSTMINPGDTITWKIQVNLVPGWLKGLSLNLIDPSGQVRQLYTLVESIPEVKEKKSVEVALSLKTHDYDLAGKYRLQWAYLANESEVSYYDPINGKEYAGKGSNSTAQNMSQFDFTIRDAGTGKQKSPQQIESIGFSKTQINPGSSAKLEIKTSGTGVLANANVTVSTPDGMISSYCDAVNLGSSGSCLDLVNKSGSYSFSVPIWTADDFTAGTYRVTQVNLSYTNGDPSFTSNDTSNWGGNISYTETETMSNGVKNYSLGSFNKNALSFTLLDAGQGTAQAPIWTELTWKNKSVQAGSIATLVITANGFKRNLGMISVPVLTTTNGKNDFVYTNQNGQEPAIRQTKPNQSTSITPSTKNGTFEVDVYVPRSAKPGNYSIGQLVLLSTTCQLSSSKDIYTVNPANGQSCQGWPNGAHTSFYLGSLSKDFGSSGIGSTQWAGYVNPLSVQLEVTAAAPMVAPKIETVDIGPTTIEYRYLYSNEQSCIGSASTGDLVDNKIMANNYWTLKVINLKPDAPVSLKLTCTDSAGSKAESSLETRTAKPIPPASPKLSLDSVGMNSAIFSIGIRDGFKYTVKSGSGEAKILGDKASGYRVEITGLKAGEKTYLVATIVDSFGQSTTSEPIYFSTELPPKPQKPNLTAGKVTTTRVEFKYEKLADLDYELTVSEGNVSDIKGSVTVSGLDPNTKIIASVKVIDKFGQSATSEDLVMKSAIPELPALPVLYLAKAAADSLTLRFTPRNGMTFNVKASKGLVKVSEGSVSITGLPANEKIDVILIMSDSYGQLKTSEPYRFTTTAAPKSAAKTTITCVKGKASKVITAVNPTCPTGYTKK